MAHSPTDPGWHSMISLGGSATQIHLLGCVLLSVATGTIASRPQFPGDEPLHGTEYVRRRVDGHKLRIIPTVHLCRLVK